MFNYIANGLRTEFESMMSHQISSVYLIYLRPGGMLLSKIQYSDWREIQDEYEDYLTSVGPFAVEELVEFLSDEYGSDDSRWGFSGEEIRKFVESDATFLVARES